MSDRTVQRSKVRAPRKRASSREVALTRQALIAEQNKNAPGLSDAEQTERAEQRLRALLHVDPDLNDAMKRLAPTSTAPDSGDLHSRAELAAALSQPAVADLLARYALTPQRRGPVSNLSAAVAVLCEVARQPRQL